MSNNFDPFAYEDNANAALDKYCDAYVYAIEIMEFRIGKPCIEKLFEALSQFRIYVGYKSKVPEVKVNMQIKACWPATVRLISRTYLDFAKILLGFHHCFGAGHEFHKVKYIEGKIEILIQGLEKINSFLPPDIKDECLDFIKDFEHAKESQKRKQQAVEDNTKNGCDNPSSVESLDKNDIYFEYIQSVWEEVAYQGICPLRSVDEIYSSDTSGCLWGCLSVVGLFFLVSILGTAASQLNQRPNSQSATADISRRSSSPGNPNAQRVSPSSNEPSPQSSTNFVVQAGEGYANLRSRPSTWESEILAKIPNGTQVDILDQETNSSDQLWYEVQINGSEARVGWIYSGLIEQR